ncbi:TetR/AcrR family transcriptional regulator [Pseudonocardia phyllosphaerae]|uniref:TetR/AcrR family transcriptional regulator n=1 Tax=Pseudonocardia phyllosphaerae TaxID=3390502 RepID=UPI0039793B8A
MTRGDATTTGRAPRTKPAPQRRRELLDAGLEVFLEKGVAAATLDQITRAAGIAKGSFYLHFESKEHLLAGLQQDFETRMVERADTVAEAAGDDPAARLDAWLDAAFTHYPDDVALHDVLFHHPVLATPHPDSEDDRRDLTDSLADVIEHGRSTGLFTVDDVELTATLLCSALHRMFDRLWHRSDDIATERMHTATRTLFRRAVGLPDAASAPQPAGAASMTE